MEKISLALLLRQELRERARKNPQYSLRAFARTLAMDPSTLSKILGGKRVPQRDAESRILRRLGVSDHKGVAQFPNWNVEEEAQISQWQDVAVLEQVNVRGFRATIDNLAKALRTSKRDIEDSVRKLTRLGMVKTTRAGIIRDATIGQSSNILPRSTTLVKQRLQRQFFEKAIASLEFDPLDSRDMTAITVAIDSSKLAEARVRIQAFRRELGLFLASGERTDSVYQISIALFPLSTPPKESSR